ncbi:MAG TPA: MarR family transcriptional regulator [Candidatus Nanoarchaeia archaeon]|nr:MarR family transcriptional regulator [Candidatus Nanoarchaeia archaeon]
MKPFLALIAVFALLSALLAQGVYAEEKLIIDISVSKNDIVEEKISLNFIANETYDSLSFTTVNRPLSILYDGDYSISQDGNYYTINFERNIVKGANSINFTLIYNDMVESNGRERNLRTSFYPSSKSDMEVKLNIPLHFALSEKEPSAIPKPASVSTDGQRITLEWKFENSDYADISVFYKGEEEFSLIAIFSFLAAIVVIAFVFFSFYKRKARKEIGEMLSSDELKIIEEIRAGNKKQKEIAAKLGFSKSKMSKIVRRLEEKCLLERKPHFKTNLLYLKEKIK